MANHLICVLRYLAHDQCGLRQYIWYLSLSLSLMWMWLAGDHIRSKIGVGLGSLSLCYLMGHKWSPASCFFFEFKGIFIYWFTRPRLILVDHLNQSNEAPVKFSRDSHAEGPVKWFVGFFLKFFILSEKKKWGSDKDGFIPLWQEDLIIIIIKITQKMKQFLKIWKIRFRLLISIINLNYHSFKPCICTITYH